jgi:hypothetical protein
VGESRHWVWVFGEIEGLRWVFGHGRMAFPASAARRLRSMGEGDRAVLYVSRGAFHNPTRDMARLAGLATVLAAPVSEAPVKVAGRDFTWTVPIRTDVRLPERAGPEVRPLVPRLSFIRDEATWGQHLRTSPLLVSEKDFQVLAGAVMRAQERDPGR